MSILEGIQSKVNNGQYEFSQHATDQSIVRHISVQEVREAIATGEIIEDYPEDKYGPSCLILGFTLGRPNWPKGLAHFLGLLIGVQNPASTGIPGQEGRVQKPGKEFGPKTAFLDGLGLHLPIAPYIFNVAIPPAHWW